ncbi:MAG: hypothetical protein FWD26_09060 [Treponema sp.]|nr:hypothetical protein [Treponema sp.]
MKSKILFFTVLIILTLLIISCHEDNSTLLPEPKGLLTVNNIPTELNEKYIFVRIYMSNLTTDTYHLFGFKNAFGFYPNYLFQMVQISDGKAILPLYRLNDNEPYNFYPFDGTDSRSIHVIAFITSDSLITTENLHSVIAAFYIAGLSPNIDIDDDMYINSMPKSFENGNTSIDWVSLGKFQ